MRYTLKYFLIFFYFKSYKNPIFCEKISKWYFSNKNIPYCEIFQLHLQECSTCHLDCHFFKWYLIFYDNWKHLKSPNWHNVNTINMYHEMPEVHPYSL